jgi:eukaryotic-like serine/threonine-protein kinase
MMSDPDRSDHAMIGQTISSYRIESRLGSGSLGIVFRALKVDTGETVAIKVAREQDESSLHRMMRSAEVLANLDHENIVRVMEVGQSDGTAYHVIEFIPGLTLAKVFAERGALPWPEVVALGLQMCAALTHIHERGLVHRNFKPSHLILSPNGQIKLVGFGLVTRDATALVTGVIEGTPGYIAPELIFGVRPVVNSATDLYALGGVLWNLLTGEHLYQNLNDSGPRSGGPTLPSAKLVQPRPRPGDRIAAIPKELDDLVIQLTDRAPQNRPSGAAAVASVLSRLQA